MAQTNIRTIPFLLMALFGIKVNLYYIALHWDFFYHCSFPSGSIGFVSSVLKDSPE